MKKVFLGGTCNRSTWRDTLIPKLKIKYFNPLVPIWNKEAYERELFERNHCDYCLYLITSKMKGVYSIAEVVDDSNKRPHKTVFCISNHDGEFEEVVLKSLIAVGKLVESNGGIWCKKISDIAEVLNESE